ncbi:MAG: geranyl transferase [Proteobacteria bacterium]|nr:geranyl transferase [Pseudomonadota bacterium]
MTERLASNDASFVSQWERYKERANQQLDRVFSELPAGATRGLGKAMRYSTLNGGKRFRAMLVYASGACFGASTRSLDAPAVALELIHAYSLVHDDLPAMDDDDLRRGRASCHIEFDEATAILVGDALQSFAFDLLAEQSKFLNATQQLKMVRQLAAASGIAGMAGGQSLDIFATGQTLDQASLQVIHEKKTGALIRAALHLGALAAPDISDRDLSIIDEYGRLIGLAFQVVDDILDQTQTSKQLGKQSGADTAMDKNTYPALLGLTASQQYADQLVQSAQQSLVKLGRDTDFLHQLAEFTRFRDH